MVGGFRRGFISMKDELFLPRPHRMSKIVFVNRRRKTVIPMGTEAKTRGGDCGSNSIIDEVARERGRNQDLRAYQKYCAETPDPP